MHNHGHRQSAPKFSGDLGGCWQPAEPKPHLHSHGTAGHRRIHNAWTLPGASNACKHPRLSCRIPGRSAETCQPQVPPGTCQSPLLPAAAQPRSGAEHQDIFPSCSLEVAGVRGKSCTHTRPPHCPNPAPRATGEEPLPRRLLASPPYKATSALAFPKQNTPNLCLLPGKTLPASVGGSRQRKPPWHSQVQFHSPPQPRNFSPCGNSQHGDLPHNPPRIHEPTPGGSSAPWGSSPEDRGCQHPPRLLLRVCRGISGWFPHFSMPCTAAELTPPRRRADGCLQSVFKPLDKGAGN